MKNRSKLNMNVRKNKFVFHFNFLKNIMQKIRLFFCYRYLGTMILMVMGFFVLYYFIGWEERVSFFTILAIVIWTRMWDARIATIGGILCLFIAMILTVSYNSGLLVQDIPETLSVWAYSFFVIGVIGQIIEFSYNKKIKEVSRVQPQKKVQQKQYFMDLHKK